jgi:hypothetical protein
LHFASSWVCLIENILALGCVPGINYFGFCYTNSGLDGEMRLLLSNQKQSLPGIVPVSDYSGVSDRV